MNRRQLFAAFAGMFVASKARPVDQEASELLRQSLARLRRGFNLMGEELSLHPKCRERATAVAMKRRVMEMTKHIGG